MPFTAEQLAIGANYALAEYDRKEPIDQINIKHKTLDWLIRHKKEASFTNGTFKEPVYIDNNSNAQNYFGADQVTYNERDPARWTDFKYYNVHDGFWFDEDRLIAAGIHLTDERDAVPTAGDKEVLINLLEQSYRGLKLGMQEHLAFETLRDGSQSSKAAPGLSHLISTTPSVGVVGGISAVDFTFWRNNINLGINPTSDDVIAEFEDTWRANQLYGGTVPDFIPMGSVMYDAFRDAANTAVSRYITNGGNTRGGVSVDPGTNDITFHGVPVVWDPTFDALDALLSTTNWGKTALFLNSNKVNLRPVKREWMRSRKPEKLPDRYVVYFGRTAKYGLTTNQRNALSILTLA